MKKLITLILILALALPALALAEYSPKLGMRLDEFINKYNAISAPLESPYKSINNPSSWTKYDIYDVAWFSPANNSSATILLLSADPGAGHVLSRGLDMVQIFIKNDADFVDLISITSRCAELFAPSFLGTSMGNLIITNLMKYYYENNYKKSGGYVYNALNEDNTIQLQFFKADGYYYFSICQAEVEK